jgi:Dictyostelium (slime mold) repeat
MRAHLRTAAVLWLFLAACGAGQSEPKVTCPASVDDGDACTADACDPVTGLISHTPVTVDDGNACTTDSCDPVTGVAHVPVPVSDGVACTVDACDPVAGVLHTPSDALCADANLCTAERCDGALGCRYPYLDLTATAALSGRTSGALAVYPMSGTPRTVSGSGYSYTLCPLGPEPTQTPPSCALEVDFSTAALTFEALPDGTYRMAGTLPVRLASLPVEVVYLSVGMSGTLTFTGNASCSGSQAFVPLPVTITFDPAAAPGDALQVVAVTDLPTVASGLTVCGGMAAAVANLVEGFYAPELQTFVEAQLKSLVEQQLCAPPPCPPGTTAGSSCRYPSSLCVSRGLDPATGVLVVPGCALSCSDGLQNGAETDVDCGGPTCPACANGGRCGANTDCVSGRCASGTCAAPMALACPSAADLPVASPFQEYVIDGTRYWSGAATSWAWSVTGGACDQSLQANGGAGSFTVSAANTSQLTFHPVLPGDYAVRLDVTTVDGAAGCDLVVRVRAPGLRVALCWDTTGATDLDLHLHRSGTTTPWFTTTPTGAAINPDDCYYSTCKCASSGTLAMWGYASSSLGACAAAPEGACWTGAASCRNPRLELDNISTAGLPEVVAVDSPGNGDTFRVMTHYYTGTVTTHPVVAVFCGDAGEVATFGAAPDLVPGFIAGGGFGAGPMWRVADVTAVVVGGSTTGCTVAPLHPPGSDTGPWVTVNDRSY